MPCQDKPAFRCKNCGHLVGPEAAGDNARPHACPCCGEGVKFTEKGIKYADPDNWEVLAETTPDRLTELGLTPESVDAPPAGPAYAGPIGPKHLHRSTEDAIGAQDKVS